MKTQFSSRRRKAEVFGLRREAERHAAFENLGPSRKAVSPLSTLRSTATEDGRSATAVQNPASLRSYVQRLTQGTQNFASVNLRASLSPQRGEGMRVRGGLVRSRWQFRNSATFPPLTPTLSPLRGEGEPVAACFRSLGYGHKAALGLCAFALMLLPVLLPAATNDLTSALQRGLFEEEANHNLEAAAQAYRDLSLRFDKDRKVAATAVFRLGEIYRKQGKTNEAVVQYERVVREFSDQETLATLSRQNLTGLNRASLLSGDVSVLTGNVSASEEANRLAAQLKGIEQLKDNPEEQARAVLAFFPDETLKQMLLNLPKLKEQEAFLRASSQTNPVAQHRELGSKLGGYRTAHSPDGLVQETHGTNLVTDAQWELRRQLSWTKDRVDFIVGVQKARLQVLQATAATTSARDTAAGDQPAQSSDEEEKEIRRIQAMIQNSPDLINAAQGEEGTPLFKAASQGQVQVAKFLLDHGAAVNAPNGISGKTVSSWTPLIGAANGGHKAMVELLLARGADVKARDRQGLTALHQAARRGFKAVIEALLDHHVDINARDDNEATPLHLALLESSQPVIELLLARGADVNAVTARELQAGGRFGFVSGSPLHIAVRRGERPLVELLLDRKAEVNAVAKGTMFGGRTPLQEAVSGERTDLVELLLQRGADPNAGVRDLPLTAAARARNAEIARALLRGGAKPDLPSTTSQIVSAPGQNYSAPRNEFGPYTPLQIAVIQGDAAMVKLLLEFKADANAKDAWGNPPVPLTRWALGNVEILRALLDAGADANASDGKGFFPLLLAASSGASAAVDLLLAHGAKTEVRGENGATPLLKAVDFSSTNALAQLLAAGADVNAKYDHDWSALHSATYNRRKTVLQMLLAKDANPNVRNNQGQTPSDLTKLPAAAFSGTTGPEAPASMQELAALLRQHGALDELPFFDRIEVRRLGFSAVAFPISTNGWNEFSLLELLAQHYGFLSAERNAVWDVDKSTMPGQFWGKAACQFPDFSRVMIRRPDRSGPRWTEIPVNAAALLDSGDCARDVKLQPGDIVEIPEADHPVNETWAGLPELQRSNLLHCISRAVTISIKGTPTPLALSPAFKPYGGIGSFNPQFVSSPMRGLTRGSFMLKSVLAQSRLLRASSDMSRVKVTRRVGDKTQEWMLNCGSGSDPDLWLRDGDVIEVPDKP